MNSNPAELSKQIAALETQLYESLVSRYVRMDDAYHAKK